VNWQEFQDAKRRLCPSHRPELLLQTGGFQGDNRTFAESQKGRLCDNTKSALFDGHLNSGSRDFVWTGDNVRVMDDFQTGGHPALAGFDSVYCAGILGEDFFFFHSGHYRPSLKNALYFFCDFVERSCRDLAGAERDDEVRDLCDMSLRVYAGREMERHYVTTFAEEAQDSGGAAYQMSGRSSTGPIAIGGPMPISIARTQPIPIAGSRPIPTAGARREPRPLPTNEEILGATPVAQFLSNSPIPTWIPDSERPACAVCKNNFTTFRRKHHCRKCGDVVCDSCSKRRVELTDPVRQPDKPAEGGPLRICDNC
jgi:FYVE zinc finger